MMNPITEGVKIITPGFSLQRIVAKLVVIAVLLGLGAWGGNTLARNHYEPLLADANKQIGVLTAANTALKASIEKQNTAITALQTEATKRQRAATAAVQQARTAAAKYRIRAQAVLLIKPPPGANQCAAAQAAFDDELRDERGWQ